MVHFIKLGLLHYLYFIFFSTFRQTRVHQRSGRHRGESVHGGGGQVHPHRPLRKSQSGRDRVQMDFARKRKHSGSLGGFAGKPDHRFAKRKAQRDPGQEGGCWKVQSESFKF